MKNATWRSAIASLAGALLLAGAAFASTSFDAPPVPPEVMLGCEEEVVYGRIVVFDWQIGRFRLEGTQYEFVADDPRVLPELDGLAVRMEVASDCSVRDLQIIDEGDEAMKRPARNRHPI